MFPILQLGPLALQLPGLFLLIGGWISTWLIDRTAKKHRVSAGILNNTLFLGLVVGIVSARLWYAARYFDVYLEAPLSLLSLNPSTLAPLEGILTGLLAAVIYGQRKELPLWPTLDVLTLPLALMAIAFGFSHLSSGDAFGAASKLPWAVELWGDRRHPSQVYEILIGAVILMAILRMGNMKLAPGMLFFTWSASAAASRLFLEAFRGDSVIVLGVLRSAQIYSLLILLGSMWALYLLSVQDVRSVPKKP